MQKIYEGKCCRKIKGRGRRSGWVEPSDSNTGLISIKDREEEDQKGRMGREDLRLQCSSEKALGRLVGSPGAKMVG